MESAGNRAGLGEARRGTAGVKAWQGWGFDREHIYEAPSMAGISPSLFISVFVLLLSFFEHFYMPDA